MKHTLSVAAGILLIATSFALHAQPAPSQPAPKPASGMDRMRDHPGGDHHRCATPDDPKACDAERQKIKAAMGKAHDACKGVPDKDRRSCMQASLCAQAPDPAKCNERASNREKRRDEHHHAPEKARDACKGKEGEDMKQCLRDQRPPRSPSTSEPKR